MNTLQPLDKKQKNKKTSQDGVLPICTSPSPSPSPSPYHNNNNNHLFSSPHNNPISSLHKTIPENMQQLSKRPSPLSQTTHSLVKRLLFKKKKPKKKKIPRNCTLPIRLARRALASTSVSPSSAQLKHVQVPLLKSFGASVAASALDDLVMRW